MAETRTIRTVLELNAQRYTAGAAAAAASAKSLAGELSKISDASGKQRANYDRVSNSLLGVGTAAAAGLGLAAKASMDWESAWAGVLKTVDGTDAELAAVEAGLRGLTEVLPASHTEIAAVAEAAGQLGVETGSVVEFTETMINLGETTNLSAEEAATGLARFSNIMGTSQDDVDRLGAAIVGLGNNYATTEAEILAMSMRLAGTGAQMGLTEGEVLGLATAMSSVGIEAEAGGTAMSMGMRKIDAAVREGGDSLAGFAEVAGMTNEEFSRLWSQDSAEGLDVFVQGLARISAEGGDVSGVLSELGIKGIRESDTFLRLAGAADLLGAALEDGNTEFERNLALVQEAEKRYATTESQLAIAKNSLVNAGIEIGASVLPVLADVAGGVSDLASWFAALPEPVQRSVTGLGALVGATGLVAGGMMRLVPAAIDTVNAFRDLRTTSPQTASALGKVAGFAVRAGAAFAALQVAGAVVDQFRELETSSEGISAGLLNTAQQGDVTKASLDELFAATGTGNAEVRDLSQALEILDAGPAAQTFDFLASGLGVFDTQTEVAQRRIGELDRALATLYTSGNTQLVADVLRESGVATEELLEYLPTLSTELTTTATGMELQADAATLAKIATGELVPVVDDATGAVTGYNTAQGDAEGATDDMTGAVDEQVAALAELQDQLSETANLLLGVRGSERDFEAAIDDATASVEEHGKTLDRSTEAGRANEAALDGIAESAHNWADAAQESGASAEELDQIMRDGRDAFLETAEAMGIGEEEAAALADQLGLMPDFVETEVEVTVTDVQSQLQELARAGVASIPIDADTGPAAESVDVFKGQTTEGGVVIGLKADTVYAEEEARAFQQSVNEMGGTVTINGETMTAQQTFDTLMTEINNGEGYVNINGTYVDASTALAQLTSIIDNSEGTVTIDGNNVPANAKTDAAKRHADGTTGTIDVDANTYGANAAIDAAARTRTAYVNVVATGAVSALRAGVGSIGRANGGWLNEGLSGGGWVPGSYPGPGIDNVMWPMAGKAGGGMLTQPLAGTEYVVNGQSAQQWGPALEAINSGITPSQMAAMIGGGSSGASMTYAPQINGPDPYVVEARAYQSFQHWTETESTGTRGA